MGKSRKTSNDLTLMGVNILKKKVRSDGEMVCLCHFIKNPDLLIIVHLDSEGHIADSTCFDLGRTIKNKVRLEANRTYNIWKQILMLRIDDYELGYRLLND